VDGLSEGPSFFVRRDPSVVCPRGRHSFRLSREASRSLGAGVYFVRLTTGDTRISRPLIVLK